MSAARISAALRLRVAETSRFRCGCCLTSRHIIGPLLEIDHIIPESRGGTHDEDNLVLACPMCNGHKADKVEATDPDTQVTVALFNPRRQQWHEHFEWIEDGTVVRGKTATERATVATLLMNHPYTVLARSLWVSVGWHPPPTTQNDPCRSDRRHIIHYELKRSLPTL
jgi:hypothetical protein